MIGRDEVYGLEIGLQRKESTAIKCDSISGEFNL